MAKRKLRLGHVPGRPLMLDAYCCAGGSAMGFYQGGWNIVGIDKNRQPNYPFEFLQGDVVRENDMHGPAGWLEILLDNGMRLPDGRQIHAVNASPPCQFYSDMSACRPGLAATYPELITPTRELLQQTGLPWVIENVRAARKVMRDPITLCGAMFGLELYRHRLFESNVQLVQPLHPTHTKPASKAAHWVPGTVMSVCGHVHPIAMAREVMEIDWTTRDELSEAIPPAFTRYLAPFLMRSIA